jgi:two-component system response regulator HydG
VSEESHMTAGIPQRARREAAYVAGSSGPAMEFEGQLSRVASSEATVLLAGENGCGKSRAAWRLHQTSGRASGPFVEVNVSALATGLLDAELFGHEEGAYTGAHRAREGRFAKAHGGTLILDGVEDLSQDVQVKLLRVLQERVVEPLGGAPRDVDVRLVATTCGDLAARVERGAFREDLYYRLAVVTLEVPPLRERLGQLPEFVQALTEAIARRTRVPQRAFGVDALERLAAHRWPGNLRELENAVERVLVLGVGQPGEVSVEELAFLGTGEGSEIERIARSALAGGLTVAELELALIDAAVREEAGNLSAAARRVGLTRRALEYRLRRRESRTEDEPEAPA